MLHQVLPFDGHLAILALVVMVGTAGACSILPYGFNAKIGACTLRVHNPCAMVVRASNDNFHVHHRESLAWLISNDPHTAAY